MCGYARPREQPIGQLSIDRDLRTQRVHEGPGVQPGGNGRRERGGEATEGGLIRRAPAGLTLRSNATRWKRTWFRTYWRPSSASYSSPRMIFVWMYQDHVHMRASIHRSSVPISGR